MMVAGAHKTAEKETTTHPWRSKNRREHCLGSTHAIEGVRAVPCRGRDEQVAHAMVRLYYSQPSHADSKRKTLRPKPQILLMEMHRSTAWPLARSETASSPSRLSPESG